MAGSKRKRTKYGKRRTRRYSRSRVRRRFLAVRRANIPSLMPESKYADAAYVFGAAVPTGLSLVAGPSVHDFNGPESTAVSVAAGGPSAIGIPGGAGFNERIGRKVFYKYISIRARVWPYNRAQMTPSQQQFRLVLVWDKQPNLSLPLSTDILNVATGLSTITFMEDRNRDRFVRLWDYTGVVTQVAASQGTDTTMVLINKKIKIGGMQVYNDTQLGGYNNIQTGSLVMLMMGDPQGSNVAAENLAIELCYRLRYVDY